MKRVFSLVIVLLIGLVLVACGGGPYKIAMITDTGDIDDGSFNQGTWEGIKDYAKENNVSHKYYKPRGETVPDYMAAIDLAVAGGAEIVITPGFYFEAPIYEAQTKYPDVSFVLLDGSPSDGTNSLVGENTLSIFFKEEQSGFLAGYATVKEGFKKLGFMGGIAVPAVQRFGIGWIAGAYYAALEDEVADFEFNSANYQYLNSFGPSDTTKSLAASWYGAGVEVIHAAAGGAGSSVMAAASERTNKWVVGVDSDQANDSNTVLTSAVKAVGQAAYDALEAFYNDEFPGGETQDLGVSELGVELPMKTSRFETFTEAQYTAIFNKLAAGTVVVPRTAAELETFLEGLEVDITTNLEALFDKI